MEGSEGEKKRESLVEHRRQEAFQSVCEALDERLTKQIGRTFEMHGREYELTSAEDCMVAYAQQMRAEMQTLHDEIIQKSDYYEEKATAKLLDLFKTYERLIGLYAELRSYYPVAGARASGYIPSLTECAEHGKQLWEAVKEQKES